MVGLAAEIAPIYEGLRGIGYPEEQLLFDFPVPATNARVPLLGFADRPFDSRTASVAVVHGQHIEPSNIAALLPLGAPVIFACLPQHFEFWSQGVSRPSFQERLEPEQVPQFFNENRAKLAPSSIYRAKAWGRIEKGYQLDFVDAGLMPLVEEEAGRKLTGLIERIVVGAKKQLGWEDKDVGIENGRWLLQATFWLLAAKILQDKQVNGFKRLRLTDLDEVYQKLATHYNGKSPQPVKVGNKARREALVAAADGIAEFGHCGCVSTEALAYLYESALIDRITRSKLGTHSTPTWLVDYIVGRLRPWIDDIAVADRRVFEPACGHAAFLISAMRLLTDLLPPNWQEPRRDYLRRRLHGLEVDPFALEIARLSLTLADVPNPNGWALTEGNMFLDKPLEDGIRNATIVLGNPPFENFDAKDRNREWLANKAAETFRRVVEYLPPDGVFGFVLPQTILRSKQATDVRRKLLAEYEIAEIDLFADKVFRYGESESTVIIGRRLAPSRRKSFVVQYQQVREGHIKEFARTYKPGSTEWVPSKRLAAEPSAYLFVPDLDAVWDALSAMPKLKRFAEVGNGLAHRSVDDPKRPPNSITESEIEVDGVPLVPGFAGWDEDQVTHGLPKIVFLNLDPETIRRPGFGVTTGEPQVLLNYARVSRGPWRLKALLDPRGHPVTSDFSVVRPKVGGVSLAVCWAILNSPVGNAYAYCHSIKRQVKVGDMRKMPIPNLTELDLLRLEKAVADYLNAAQSVPQDVSKPSRKPKSKRNSRQKEMFSESTRTERSRMAYSADDLKTLHWRIDAEVLRLYNLPSALERQVLGLFSGIRRRGVPFEQTEYFPEDFTDLERLQDLLAITVDWPETNLRRAKLLDLEEEERNTPGQQKELDELQRLADASVSLLRPVQMEGADEIIENLKRAGLWKEQP